MSQSKKTVVYLGDQEFLSHFFKEAFEKRGSEFFHFETLAEVTLSLKELGPSLVLYSRGIERSGITHALGSSDIPVVALLESDGMEEVKKEGSWVQKPLSLDTIEDIIKRYLS